MVRTTLPTRSYAILFPRYTSFSRTCSTPAASTAITLGPGREHGLSKVSEAIMTKRLMSWAENTDKHPTEQSGFRKHHSTNDKLFELTQTAFLAQRLSRRVCAIFLDIKKAFDMAYVTNCYT